MIHIKKLSLCIGLVVLTLIMGGCGLMNSENSKENINETSSEKKIKQSFNKSLKMYPIKNLEDFYDKEGFRDGEFDKNDKGTWVLSSTMAIESSKGVLVSKGMVLFIDRNKKIAHGKYVIHNVSEDQNGELKSHEKEYPVKMVNNKFISLKPIKETHIAKEIESFEFFGQYGKFKDLSQYGKGDFSYNPNVPNYSAEYQLSNDDYNVKQLRKRYDIPTNKAPKLILKGVGEFEGSSIGYKTIEFEFDKRHGKNVYFSNSINFKPSKG
ncbi:tandem-type lipoprotein [Staphylococcus agnetis]|uniref:tandem-type lipoprotein n=1 Tax=Staphylococcus agnetis TaxID=985762 RepID=UPI0021D27974|nr:tandem-type lipoprotein [Staphylococcus agnetis]UXU64295.1 tandem-type lipoprotein [Staphylococcus agnetis]UXU66635.1 tandem-type lipoprotein [Staphylococcus agnetis]